MVPKSMTKNHNDLDIEYLFLMSGHDDKNIKQLLYSYETELVPYQSTNSLEIILCPIVPNHNFSIHYHSHT